MSNRISSPDRAFMNFGSEIMLQLAIIIEVQILQQVADASLLSV
jgi:hypothetical protein